MSLRDKPGEPAKSGGLGFNAPQTFNAGAEAAEVTLASAGAVYVWAGCLEDGTSVVRDANGVLHALVPVKRACDA